jgi:hypothetical protein
MANWKKVLVSGSSIEVANISASGDLIVKNIPNNTGGAGTSTLVYDTTTGKVYYTGSYGGGGGGDSFFTEFVTDNIRTENNVFITGAATLAAAPAAVDIVATQSVNNYALVVSQSAYFYNHNVGYPTSNAWGQNLQGSFFNSFDANTDVSEILRFLAGLLSSSAPSPTPNTKTFSSITSASVPSTLGAISGTIPGGSTNSSVLYTISRGFGSIGTAFFGNAVNNGEIESNYALKYTSVAGGSTNVSSSADAQLFGLGELTSGNATAFNVSGTLNWIFENNNSRITTATSRSEQLLTTNTFGTTATGLTLGKINTTNPAVIPAQYQDAKFASIFSQSLYNGGLSLSNISSSGFYQLSASISISSGSSTYTSPIVSRARIFFIPRTTIDTSLSQTIYFDTLQTSSLTAVSNSLSGAPYLRTATWSIRQRISGAFDPLYHSNANHLFSDSDVAQVVISSISPGASSCNINSSGLINTSNAIFSSNGVVRSTSTYPSASDVIQLSASLSFTATGTSIGAAIINPTIFTATNTSRDRYNSANTSDQIFQYHKAGEFGQPLSSGSMAYYNFPAVLTPTATSETFNDESNRIILNDNILSFTGTAFTSGSRLAAKELQVKPAYLVYPGGSKTYWYPSGYGDTFKYYVRKFQRTSAINTFTLSLGQTLIAWDDTSTTTSPAIAIVFESAVNGQNGLTRTRLFDPYYTTGLRTLNIGASTDGTNPFGSAIDYYGIRTGAVSGTTYTIEISNANAVYMNGSTYDEFYVIIRYKAEPTTPVQTLSVSAGS